MTSEESAAAAATPPAPESPESRPVRATPAPAEIEKVEVTNILDLQSVIDQPFILEIDYGGKRYRLKCRRLRPRESAILEDILRSAMPTVIRGDKPENDRLDYGEAYVQKKTKATKMARALAIYWCVAVVAAGKLLDRREDILEYIQNLWTEAILETIWEALQDGGVRRAEMIDFISGPSSQTN